MSKPKKTRYFTFLTCPECGKTLILNSTIYMKGGEIKACSYCYTPNMHWERNTLKGFIEGGGCL